MPTATTPTVHEAYAMCHQHNEETFYGAHCVWDHRQGVWQFNTNTYDTARCDHLDPPTECSCYSCQHADCDEDPCSDCEYDRAEREREAAQELIESWDYRPDFRFYGKGPAFLGAELELFTGHDMYGAAESAIDIMDGHGYLKEDGSVDGFEIVTHPHDYESHRGEFPWRDLLSAMSDHGMYDSGEAGLHVHVSRDAFTSPSHAYRWQKFMYGNQDMVRKIARRESDRWAPWPGPESNRVQQRAIAKTIKHGSSNGHEDAYLDGEYIGRYRAINPCNRDTIEIRVFRSSLAVGDIYAALALVDASVNYTRKLTVADVTKGKALTSGAFKSHLTGNDAYSELASRL